jgi:hypothetical protein
MYESIENKSQAKIIFIVPLLTNFGHSTIRKNEIVLYSATNQNTKLVKASVDKVINSGVN